MVREVLTEKVTFKDLKEVGQRHRVSEVKAFLAWTRASAKAGGTTMPGKFRDQQVGQCESRTGLAQGRVEDEVTELWVHGSGDRGGPCEAL